MDDPVGAEVEALRVPERALLAFREALNRGTNRRMLTENGKQHFIFAGGVFLVAIAFRPSGHGTAQAGLDAFLTFETDVKPYVFSASHLAAMLQLFGGELAAIRYEYGIEVHGVTVELRGATGFDLD